MTRRHFCHLGDPLRHSWDTVILGLCVISHNSGPVGICKGYKFTAGSTTSHIVKIALNVSFFQVTWADGNEGYGKHYFEYNH